MADLVQLPPQTEEPGAFTQHMRAAVAEQTAAYEEHQQLKRDYAKALQEIAQLRAELTDLRNGRGVVVEIAGKKIPLVVSEDMSALVTITDAWVNEKVLPNGNVTADKNLLADSFVL